MPTLNDLRIAVDQGGVAPDNVRLLASTAYDLFFEDPSHQTLCALGLFRTLAQHIDDGQGVTTAVLAPFQSNLLPLLKSWLATDTSFCDLSMIDRVAKSMMFCIQKMP